uniref:restriction endonuclease subunit S n=1 Tax=Thiolapillus sp. TaxID=2017437 RepID=UPI003AF6567E
GVQPEFLVRFMLSVGFIREVDSSTYGAKMPRASWDFIGNLPVTLPPTEEQSTIAAFLDEKTTQIDQLIEKKTRFIELIKEKRAALVTEAVTGKFDARTGKPYAEYKDSGVEWLGKVPAHWEVKPLKRGYSVKLGKMLQPVQQAPQDVLKPYLRASNIQPDGIYVSGVKEMWFSPLELGVLRLKYGDLLVSEGGDVGRSAIWRRELEEAYYQNSINRVRGLEGNNNYYLNYLLSCIKESEAIDVICNRLSIAHLTTEKLNEIQILFPTAEEQSAIAAFLDEKTTQVDQLIEKTQQSIDLLKEKRAALITAAVTGKIDVRNERI